MANTILAKMAVQIAANTSEFSKGLNSASSSLKTFTSDIGAFAAAAAAAFSIREVASFALEMNKLAGTFEGVQKAFNRLPNSTLLMDKLQESTHGTVDQLMLMQQALRAKNFGISVKDLGTYLEFAAIRAQQTGESIDYMVNSIILGLGRGSIKILDNLQVNIAKIKETVKETGVSLQEAFRQQVVEQMKTIGGYAETSATKVAELEVAFKSLRLELSKKIESPGFINFITESVEALRIFVKAGGDPLKMKGVLILEEIEKNALARVKNFTNALKGTIDAQKEEVQQEMNTLVEIINKRNAELRKVDQELSTLGQGHATLEQREGLFAQKGSMSANIKTMQRTLELLKEYLTNMKSGADETGKFVDNLAFMKQELELLNEEFEKTDKNDKTKLKNIGAEIIAIEAQIKALNSLRNAQKENNKFRGLSMQFTPDIEAEGSTNPELRNEQAINNAKEFSKELMAIGTSAEFAGGALIKLTETTQGTFNEAAKSMIEISGLITSGIVDLANAFGEAAVAGGQEFGKNILRSIAGFAQQFGAILIATGIGAKAFKSFSPIGMIGAGVALVALGGAVRATIANRPSLGSDGGGGGSFPSRGVTTNDTFQNLSFSTSISGTDFNVLLGNTAFSDSYVKPKWRK